MNRPRGIRECPRQSVKIPYKSRITFLPLRSQLQQQQSLKPGVVTCADEGFKDYKMLYELGVNLVFLNEPLINTSVFDSTRNNLLNIDITTGNAAVDTFFKGNIELINNFMMALAEEQIKAAFEQSEKEVTDLHSRISQSIREAKRNGTKIGISKGITLITKKSIDCQAIIKKHAKDFGGTLEDPDVINLCGCSRNSYYKYKREIKIRGHSPLISLLSSVLCS